MNNVEPYWCLESHCGLTSLSIIWRSQSTGNSGLGKGTKPFPGMRFQAGFTELLSRPRRGRWDRVIWTLQSRHWVMLTYRRDAVPAVIRCPGPVLHQAESTSWEVTCICRYPRRKVYMAGPEQARQGQRSIWPGFLKLWHKCSCSPKPRMQNMCIEERKI